MSQCKGCGKEIVWGTTAEGKKVPLDPKAPVYSLFIKNGENVLTRTLLHMVTHFSTCSKANDFSSSHKSVSA